MAWKQRGKMVKHGKSSTAKWPKELKQQMVQAVCRKKPTHSCHNRHQMMETNSGMTFSTISRKTLGNLGTGWEASANLTVNNDTYVSNIVRNLLRADSLRGFANNPQICSSSHILTQHEIIQTKAQKKQHCPCCWLCPVCHSSLSSVDFAFVWAACEKVLKILNHKDLTYQMTIKI